MEPLRDAGDKNLPINKQPSVQDGVGFQFSFDNVASKDAEQSTTTGSLSSSSLSIQQ
ncbi:hypothetical protein DERP_014771 [Dermatophagoides pteronyssinus]|uniref:Uncharacterized protein n=1 Tax=Dermatophagoides pteronyssinus TaxID=6956 RepID=A0ABQ8JCC5_DERPT|nr:hypothetical protein DERP_014771 [Dermatophagoides pteronyssinus]